MLKYAGADPREPKTAEDLRNGDTYKRGELFVRHSPITPLKLPGALSPSDALSN